MAFSLLYKVFVFFLNLILLSTYSLPDINIFFNFLFLLSGFLKAGGIQSDGAFANCTGGAAGYIDKIILGERRLWQNAPLRRMYKTEPFDPENILGAKLCSNFTDVLCP